MSETALVTREQERATATTLYGQDAEIKEMIDGVRAVAPWVKNRDPRLAFDDNEVALVVRRSMAMGLDPLNPHEVQIWKDARGTVNFQISYTLMTEWVRRFKGTHTEPEYHRLSKEELKEEGLGENDIAVRCSFVMDDCIEKLIVLSELYGQDRAKRMVAVTGLGVATIADWNGPYFAPAGRSKAWKVQKRALVDAYRKKFGTPTRAEIEELRRVGGWDKVEAEDWEGVAELDLRPGDAAALAKSRALDREHEERMTVDAEYREEHQALQAEAADALFGVKITPQQAPAEPEKEQVEDPGYPVIQPDLWDQEQAAGEDQPDYPTDRWDNFRDYVVRTIDHYVNGKRVAEALNKCGIGQPWLHWSPEMAARCWECLTDRVPEG